MSFKVPIGFRQLEDKNTEVVYDDGTTWSFGGSGGEGGEDMVFKVIESAEGTLDKSFSEIKEAYESGKIIVIFWESNTDYPGAKYCFYLGYLFHDEEYPDDDMLEAFCYMASGIDLKYFHPVEGVLTEYFPD